MNAYIVSKPWSSFYIEFFYRNVKPDIGLPKYNCTNALARQLHQMSKTKGMSEYQAVSIVCLFQDLL